MRTDYRQCGGGNGFNTGANFCPLQPGKVKGIILTYHGKKLPLELTAESLEEACAVHEVNIDELLNKRVVVSGATLQGTRFWSAKTNQLVPSTKYNFNIIRPAKTDDKDTATFSFSGFVYKPLTERTDADNNVEYYQMSLAQANYKEDGMHVVDFIVDKDNLKAIQVIESKYEQGSTIEIFGICKNIVTNVTKTEETAFGEPITRILPRSDKKLVITQGKEPIIGEGEYTIEDIKRLNAAFIAEGEQIKNKAVNTASAPATNNASSPAKPMSKKSALAGLI